MSIFKNYATDHLRLSFIDVLEIVILIVTYLKKVCVLNKTEDLNLSIFSMITGLNESKILIKSISCGCKCKLDGRRRNSNQKGNNDKCRHGCKTIIDMKKIYLGSHHM